MSLEKVLMSFAKQVFINFDLKNAFEDSKIYEKIVIDLTF